MKFEERELKRYAEAVSKDQLEVGSVYFFITYVDDQMLIPTMETVVFVGRNLEAGDVGQVYFQDIDSYRQGVRYSAPNPEEREAHCFTGSEDELGHVFDYEHALEELMKCSLRRRGTSS